MNNAECMVDHDRRIEKIRSGLSRRYAIEKTVRWLGLAAIAAALLMLLLLFGSILYLGASAFKQTHVALSIYFDPAVIDPQGQRSEESLSDADYGALVKHSLSSLFPEVQGRGDKRYLAELISTGAAFELRQMVLDDPSLIGMTRTVHVPADDDVDMLLKGNLKSDGDEKTHRLTDLQLKWIESLKAKGLIEGKFNKAFFTKGDSREPELSGMWGALVGSFYTMIVTFCISFPLGVATALYLEEFATQSIWTDVIEVNINNLAAVPSIVYGLLGLAVFLNFAGLPRSAPLVGGLVLSLMTLPIIIIASRAAIKSVPPSVRDAALGVGASKMQCVLHHVLPLAMPGMLTGTIIGMAHALGETAPLLMIGMVAFIVDIPAGVMDKATLLPVQIYLWADSPERAFVERTAAAIMVLLAFLMAMNAIAIYMRKKFEKRW